MEKKVYSFKEACEKTGFASSAIRYYEKEFSLDIPRDKNQRRIFTRKELDILFFIKDLKDKNYSNSQIKVLIESDEFQKEVAVTADATSESNGILETGFVQNLESKLSEINNSICQLNQNVTSKERDLIISENMKLKMENKQKAYEIIQLKERLNHENGKKRGFFSRMFGRK